jgi:transposase InsO family protein
MKYRFIQEHRKEFRLVKMCQVLEVSRSGYYNYVRGKGRQAELKERMLLEEIKKIHKKSRNTYGSPRIYRELRKNGFICNRKRIARIMRVNGIKAKTKRKYKVTTDSGHNRPVAENLLRQNFSFAERNQAWASDITYLWTEEGWLYLCCIMDLYSRMIVGWCLNKRMTANLITTAIKKAVSRRGESPGLIFHSDRGSQYASGEVRDLLKSHGMIQSMSGKGNCYDNAVMESYFHTLKSELISFENFKTREEASINIFEYIEIFYNRQRSHSTLGYLSPAEFEDINKINLVA